MGGGGFPNFNAFWGGGGGGYPDLAKCQRDVRCPDLAGKEPQNSSTTSSAKDFCAVLNKEEKKFSNGH